MAAATVKPSTLARRSGCAATLANSPNSTRTAILVYDFWEKLAGASLALASAVHLCRLARAALVQPFVESSMLVPFPGAGRLPLSAYYSVPHLQKSLAPQQLLSIDEWERRVAAAAPSARTAVVVVWTEFPAACTSALSTATGLARCPSACVKRAEKELASKHQGAWERVKDWPLTCCAPSCCARRCAPARCLISPVRGGDAAQLAAQRRAAAAAASASCRRCDRGRCGPPTCAPPRAPVEASGARYGAHGAVQLRANHLAHGLHAKAAGGGGCTTRLQSCLRDLSARTRALAPAAQTFVASDLATLFNKHQDGESHRRHAYVRECLQPSLAPLMEWYRGAGRAFNCSAGSAAAPGLGRKGCDAGALGLTDLVIAASAAAAGRGTWLPAFLEWIAERKMAGRPSTFTWGTQRRRPSQARHAVPRRVVLVARRPRGLDGGGGVGGGGARGVGGDRELGAGGRSVRRRRDAVAPKANHAAVELAASVVAAEQRGADLGARVVAQVAPVEARARVVVRVDQLVRQRVRHLARPLRGPLLAEHDAAAGHVAAGDARALGTRRAPHEAGRRDAEPLERLAQRAHRRARRERAVQRLLAARRLGRVAQRLVGEDLLEVVVGGEGGGGGFAVGRDVGHRGATSTHLAPRELRGGHLLGRRRRRGAPSAFSPVRRSSPAPPEAPGLVGEELGGARVSH